jgi:hypothetical protein
VLAPVFTVAPVLSEGSCVEVVEGVGFCELEEVLHHHNPPTTIIKTMMPPTHAHTLLLFSIRVADI